MNATSGTGALLRDPVQHTTAGAVDDRHLDALEEEAIFVLREVAASFERPALLFSGGKDSCVVLHLALKAFKHKRDGGNGFTGKLPFPLLHVDTGHNFAEVITFRDQRWWRSSASTWSWRTVEDSISARHGAPGARELKSRNGASERDAA